MKNLETIQGVQLNLDALKGISKEKFIAKFSKVFLNVEYVWDQVKGRIEAPKPKTSRKRKTKEEKFSFEKVEKPEADESESED